MAAEAKSKHWRVFRVCMRWMVHTEGGGVLIAVRLHLGDIQELLIAHVAFAAAEEDVGTLLPLDALVTAEHTVIFSSARIFGI